MRIPIPFLGKNHLPVKDKSFRRHRTKLYSRSRIYRIAKCCSSKVPRKSIFCLILARYVLTVATPTFSASATYSFGLWPHDAAASIPQSLLVITLISNFGTFLLYMMTCIIAIIAYREHHAFHGFKHVFVPVFGLLANFGCMLFYLVGPFSVAGMSWKEPYIALGVAAVWGRSELGRPLTEHQYNGRRG